MLGLQLVVSQPPVLLASVSYEQRDGNQRKLSPGCTVGGQALPIENAAGVSSL